MICLSADTSSKAASVALLDDGEIIYSQTLNDGRTHSQKLMPMIEACFEITGRDIADVDFFAVASGPGSFTGVRIAVAAIKGLAHAGSKPVAAVNTLDALYHGVRFFSGRAAVLLDARGGRVFAGLYEDGKCLSKNRALHMDDLLGELAGYKKQIIFAGCGAAANKDKIIEKIGDRAVFAPEHLMNPGAACAGMLGYEIVKNGQATDYISLKPSYAVKSSAERNLGKH